jgi:hypothetical protein
MNTVTVAAHIVPAPRHGPLMRVWRAVMWR